jgi:hypothetical protein
VPRVDRFSDRFRELRASQRELLGELLRLEREEEYLQLKVRQAREQVRYYEGLLSLLRKDWGRAPGLSDLVRRLG